MKEKYIYSNGKISVLDDKLGLVEYDYQDNIDDVLIKENMIEKLEVDIKSISFELGVQKTLKETKYRKRCYLLNTLISIMISLIVTLFLCNDLKVIFEGVILGTSVGMLFNVIDVLKAIKVQNNINALEIQIKEFEKLLKEEKKKLYTLRKNKTTIYSYVITKNDKQFQYNNLSEMVRLSKLKELYWKCGYDINKFYNYLKDDILKDDILKDVLCDEYNDDEIKIINNVVIEHGPRLVKKR